MKDGRGRLRIIGGAWRGRRLHFPDRPDLRPTGDRIRETLFNWLQFTLPGARCLDLFAGSGALGLEALSRGAAEVVMLERDPAVANVIRANLAALGASNGRVETADALVWLTNPARPFDIVFVDPPFRLDLHAVVCERLEQGGWLAEGAYVYLESPAKTELILPANWDITRHKTAGQVDYRLVHRTTHTT